MFKPYNVYIDLDGVLVNFFDKAFSITGKRWDDPIYTQKHEREARNEMIKRHLDFAHLPVMPDFDQLWNFIKHFSPDILTAFATWDPQGSERGKKIWCHRYLQVPDVRIHVVSRKNKQFYARAKNNQPNVLIDDYSANIEEWANRGGIGILHKNARDTIAKMKAIGFQV